MFWFENVNFTKALFVVVRDCDEIFLTMLLKKIQKTLREIGRRRFFVYNCYAFQQGQYKWTVVFHVFPFVNEQSYFAVFYELVFVMRPLLTSDWGSLRIEESNPFVNSLITSKVCANSYKLLKFRLARDVTAAKFLSFLIASFIINELVFDHKTKKFRLNFPVYAKEDAGHLTLFISNSGVSQMVNLVEFIKAKTSVFGFVFFEK
jgi:hypothetical protein